MAVDKLTAARCLREHLAITMDGALVLVDINPAGMRDEFANAALTGMLANPKPRTSMEAVVRDAYKYADIMLEVRNANR